MPLSVRILSWPINRKMGNSIDFSEMNSSFEVNFGSCSSPRYLSVEKFAADDETADALVCDRVGCCKNDSVRPIEWIEAAPALTRSEDTIMELKIRIIKKTRNFNQ